MIMILMTHSGYENTVSFRTVHRLLSWCSSFKKYSHTTLWCFLPDSSFTRLNLLDNRNQCSGLIVQFSLPPSSYFSRPWGLLLTLFLLSRPFISSLLLAVNLPCALYFYVCLSVWVCLYVSQPPCMLSVDGSCFVFWNFLSCILPLSPCLLAFSISSLRWVLYAKFVSAVCL